MKYKVRLKLTQVKHKFPNRPFVVGGVEIALTKGGQDGSLVTPTWQAATLELVEVAGLKDKTAADRVLLTVPGFIREQNGSPFFTTGNADTPPATPETATFTKADSDFALDVIWDATTFQVPTISFVRFPWEASEEANNQDLRARLTIGTTVEAELKDTDKLDVRMEYFDVPEDGIAGQTPSKCIGFGTVYPEHNNNMKDAETVPFSGNTLNVWVHKDIGASVNNLAPGGYDFTKLTAALTDILASGGFNNVNIVEVDWADPKLLAIGTVSGTPGSQTLTPSQTPIPYFDAWILLDTQTVWSDGMETGRSETATYQLSAATKVLNTPITILNGALASLVPVVDNTQLHIFLANVIAHEIGHALGLNHGLDADVSKGPPSSCTFKKASGSGTMTNFDVQGKNVYLQRFGPVHRDALKKHYLL